MHQPEGSEFIAFRTDPKTVFGVYLNALFEVLIINHRTGRRSDRIVLLIKNEALHKHMEYLPALKHLRAVL